MTWQASSVRPNTEEEQTAATKLQAVQRGRAARADVQQLKKDREGAAADSDAAGAALATAPAAAAKAGALPNGEAVQVDSFKTRVECAYGFSA